MVTRVQVIIAPVHAGTRGMRVGAGPAKLLECGLIDRLRAIGACVEVEEIESVEAFEGEIGRSWPRRCLATNLWEAIE